MKIGKWVLIGGGVFILSVVMNRCNPAEETAQVVEVDTAQVHLSIDAQAERLDLSMSDINQEIEDMFGKDRYSVTPSQLQSFSRMLTDRPAPEVIQEAQVAYGNRVAKEVSVQAIQDAERLLAELERSLICARGDYLEDLAEDREERHRTSQEFEQLVLLGEIAQYAGAEQLSFMPSESEADRPNTSFSGRPEESGIAAALLLDMKAALDVAKAHLGEDQRAKANCEANVLPAAQILREIAETGAINVAAELGMEDLAEEVADDE